MSSPTSQVGWSCYVAALFLTTLCQPADAQSNRPEDLRLEPISAVTRDDLQGVTSVEVSRDGKFLYATAWQASTVVVFRIGENAALEHVQTISEPTLNGAVDIRFDPDDRFAVVPAFRSSTLVLFRRDAQTGRLEIADVAEDLGWAIDVAVSPDGKFVYVADSGSSGSTAGAPTGSLIALQIFADGKLKRVQRISGHQFDNARGVLVDSSGQTVYVTSSTAGTLVSLTRDPSDGTLTEAATVADGEQGADGLDGVMTAALSPDGEYLYTAAGRFRGDHAVSTFRCMPGGRLVLVQQLFAGQEGIGDFGGGNRILVTPDDTGVYTTGTTPGSLAYFQRSPTRGRLVHLATLTEIEPPWSVAGAVGLAFSPDGKYLFVGAETANTITGFRYLPPQSDRAGGN